jgi:hypothetical protein
MKEFVKSCLFVFFQPDEHEEEGKGSEGQGREERD